MTLKLPFAAFALFASSVPLLAQSGIDLFEKNARPVFAGKCQGCHNAKLKSGGLDLSSTEGIKEAAAGGFFGKR